MARADRGAILLEVMVALAILASAGISLVALTSNALRSELAMRRREETLLAADRVLAATTLLTRNDLERRIGKHRVGEFVVDVQRPERTLFRIAIAEADAEVESLVTVVYRPATP